ncbi:hypothetical protein Cantr_04019 [Candida viswanathii]|uniref:MIOREX complex component 11 n=1 Tax=Candida viswanathii TaxID=5486 RepID=A0A367XQM3_9ASCO|nr:hypothetical protein Cantr_04019 [Candida viswanathii]
MIRLIRLQPARFALSRSPLGIRSFTTTAPRLRVFQNKPQPTRQPTTATSKDQQQLDNHPILKRVPKFLRSYASKFINAPISHLISFLVLHELTAIIPLVSLWYFFHTHPNYVPMEIPGWALEQGAKVIDYVITKVTNWEVNSKDKMQMIIEGAYAFSIVKFLVPVRVVLSLYLMPWFAKWFVVPILNIFSNFRQIVSLKKKQGKAQAFEDVKTKKIDKPRL